MYVGWLARWRKVSLIFYYKLLAYSQVPILIDVAYIRSTFRNLIHFFLFIDFNTLMEDCIFITVSGSGNKHIYLFQKEWIKSIDYFEKWLLHIVDTPSPEIFGTRNTISLDSTDTWFRHWEIIYSTICDG
jgi:hypothetical protein